MILIVHGDNISLSRNTLISLQEKLNSTKRLEYSLSSITPAALRDYLYTFDFFEGAPFFVLDVSGAGRLNVDEYVEVIKGMPSETTLVILSDKKLGKTNGFIKASKDLKAKIIENNQKEDSNIFNFVDSVFNGDRKRSYKELRQLLLEEKDSFYIFSMLQYGLRNVAGAKFKSKKFESASSYIKKKASSQAARFSEKEIKALYNEFYTLDRDVKIGKVLPDVLIPLAIEKVLVYINKSKKI